MSLIGLNFTRSVLLLQFYSCLLRGSSIRICLLLHPGPIHIFRSVVNLLVVVLVMLLLLHALVLLLSLAGGVVFPLRVGKVLPLLMRVVGGVVFVRTSVVVVPLLLARGCVIPVFGHILMAYKEGGVVILIGWHRGRLQVSLLLLLGLTI